MKQQVKEEQFIHKEAGILLKKVLYTWDETKYATLEEAITAFKEREEKVKEQGKKPPKERVSIPHQGYDHKELVV